MTDEEINIAIAEACGWKFIPEYCHGEDQPPEFTTVTPDGKHLCGYYPDYCNDLNACRGIIEWLNSSENDRRGAAVAFCEALKEIHEEDNSCWVECAVPSAKQVCRAFLRAFNRWQR